MRLSTGQIIALASATLIGAAIAVTTFELPSPNSVQTGYRGTGMAQVQNQRREARLLEANQAPPAIPAAPNVGPKAGQLYRNVQVLGELGVAEFARTMAAMTTWVSPEQGCNYCHNPNNMASDEIYTKVVARRMLQMTVAINTTYTEHVQQTGVTCYTCHRGQPVPAQVWSEDTLPRRASGLSAGMGGQNLPASSVGTASLPYDPFTPFLLGNAQIRVQSETAHTSPRRPGIKDTEWTYGLMIHMSNALGVNCGFCHNSRAWNSWEESSPQRVSAWYGIRMVRTINNEYIVPLTPNWVANPTGPADGPHTPRIGHQGDALKANCATCHQGVNRPLYGAAMAREFPALITPAAAR